MLANLWARWKVFAQRVGDFQARLILTFIYFFVVGPFGVIVTFLRDPLKIKRPPLTSVWVPRLADPANIDSCRRQF